jgi:predicted phage terminase large subunit-like protein
VPTATAPPPLDVEHITRDLDAIEAELSRRSLRHFVTKVWPLVEPDVPFVPNWHIDRLCALLEAVSRGEVSRLLINVPPGTMKSLLVSVLWPTWEWATRSNLRYLTTSYGAHLTIRDNLRVRHIVQSLWYQQYFSVDLVDDQNQKTRFNTLAGGYRIASSVGGAHPDRIIIDDPLTAQQARSDVERSAVNHWFDRTIATRGVTRNTAIVVVMQRLHEEDLSGHLLARGGWEHVCWPMRFDAARPDPRDVRTRAGELLWPSLFTEQKVRQLEVDLGPYGTAGQLQQQPAPEGGGLFKREWFKFIEAAPRKARRVRAWDTAATADGGDWTVGTKLAEASGLFFIESVLRDQLGPAGVDALMQQTARADGKAVAIRELREPGASGKAVIDAHVRAFVGYDYTEHRVGHDKVTEARPFRAQVEAGNVYLVRTGDAVKDAWIEPYLQELADFPTGKHDDQVDASSAAFNEVLTLPAPSSREVVPTGVGDGSYWNGLQG